MSYFTTQEDGWNGNTKFIHFFHNPNSSKFEMKFFVGGFRGGGSCQVVPSTFIILFEVAKNSKQISNLLKWFKLYFKVSKTRPKGLLDLKI